MGSYSNNYDVMIIDSNVDRRMRLKNATVSAESYFGDVQLCADFSIATDRLRKLRDRMVVFVSEDFPKSSLTAFVEIAKNTCAGRDSAYILNINPKQSNDATILCAGLVGVDGVLLEPFSVDSLITTTEEAAKLYYQRRTEREKRLVGMLVSKILKSIDSISTAKAIGNEPGAALCQYRDLGSTIKHLSPAMREYFFEQLIEQSLLAVVPPELTLYLARQRKYQEGIVERVKEKKKNLTSQVTSAASKILRR